MSEEKKHIIYTAADIQKYLSGQMNTLEMYAIEKAALYDPLLAEAIDGYDEMEQKNWSEELAGLRRKIESTENKPVAIVYPFRTWWRAAAAVVIIGSGVAITYLFNQKKTSNTITIAKTTKPDTSIKTKTGSLIHADSSTSTDLAINDKQKKITTLPSPTTANVEKHVNTLLADSKKEYKTDSDFIYKPPANPFHQNNKDIAANSYDNDEAQIKSNQPIIISNESTRNAQLNELSADKGFLAKQNKANNTADNIITAQVVTADDKPVAFANVSLQKNRSNVYTDEKGNFTVPATDTAISGVVTSAGYIPKKFNLKNSITENKIVLLQDSVTVTLLNSGRSKTTAKPLLRKEIENDEEDAEPAIGWIEYNNYLSNNLVFPSEAKEKNIHGVVEVFVKLKENGDISQLKINKALCAECDAEAVRLVKGPKWEVKKNKAKKAKVEIRF